MLGRRRSGKAERIGERVRNSLVLFFIVSSLLRAIAFLWLQRATVDSGNVALISNHLGLQRALTEKVQDAATRLAANPGSPAASFDLDRAFQGLSSHYARTAHELPASMQNSWASINVSLRHVHEQIKVLETAPPAHRKARYEALSHTLSDLFDSFDKEVGIYGLHVKGLQQTEALQKYPLSFGIGLFGLALVLIVVIPALNRLTAAAQLSERLAQEALVQAEIIEERNRELEMQDEELQRYITHSELMTKASQNAARRFEDLFQKLPVACLGFDSKGAIFEWNQQCVELFGAPAEDVLMKPMWDFMAEDRQKRRGEILVQQVFKGKPIQNFEWDFTRLDGKQIVILCSVFPIMNTEDQIIAAIATCVDITERKHAEARLRSLSKLTEISSMGILIRSKDREFVFANQAFSKMCGIPLSAFGANDLHNHWLDHGKVDREKTQEIQNAFKEKRSAVQDFAFHHPNGETLFYRGHLSPIFDSRGNVEQWVSIFEDTTERTLATEKLRSLSKITEMQGTGIFYFGADGHFSFANLAMANLSGYSEAELTQMTIDEVFVPSFPRQPACERFEKAIEQRVAHRDELMFKTKEGRIIWADLQMSPIFDENGQFEQFVVVATDVSDRVAIEAKVKESEERHRTITESLHEGICLIDANYRILQVNKSAARILGMNEEIMIGASLMDCGFLLVNDQGEEISMDQWPAVYGLTSGIALQSYVVGVKKDDGQIIWLSNNAVPLFGEDGQPNAVIVSFSDVTASIENVKLIESQMLSLSEAQVTLEMQKLDLEDANRRLASLAETDGLTLLYNHKAMQERTEAAIVELDGKPISFLLMDVDHFKQFNDTYGHPAGDTVLKQVAAILREVCPEGCVAARYGGEEFAFVCPGMSKPQAEFLAALVVQSIARASWEMRQITVSLGVSTLDGANLRANHLIEQADRALYHSKHNGRNQATHFSALETAA